VAGPPGSGKTTLLAALDDVIPGNLQRVYIDEADDIAEWAMNGGLESDVEYHENALDGPLHQVVGIALETVLAGGPHNTV